MNKMKQPSLPIVESRGKSLDTDERVTRIGLGYFGPDWREERERRGVSESELLSAYLRKVRG